MLVGETVTVTVSANTNSSIVAGGTLTNIASIEWTSLDGTDANERDGAGGVDDYANSGSADLDIDDPTITKNLINTSIVDTNNANDDAVIGETIQYEVTMSVPEGVLESAEIIDTLDSGLEFVSLDAIIPLSGGGATTAITTTVGTGDFTDLASFAPSVAGDDHTFGTITNSASGDGVAESLTLRYTVRVDNVAGNTTEADTMLNNSAVLQWEFDSTTESTAAANAAEVEVIEPLLQLSKVVDDDTPRIGQVVNYTLQLQHTGDSDADAQDVNFVDTLPAGMTLNLASINVTGATVDADSSTGNTIDLFSTRLHSALSLISNTRRRYLPTKSTLESR
jgi:fimbrial isopeptide formation D2 family protein/uncharacterized repeat protein (TIGR01451 family)